MSALKAKEKVVQGELKKQLSAVIEKRAREVTQESSTPDLTPELLSAVAGFHIKHEDREKFTSYDQVLDVVTRYFNWLHERKPRNYTSKRRAGSMHRLMRYIDLKRALAYSGMHLMPSFPRQPRNPFADKEVIELRLSFLVERGSEHHRLFDVDSPPAEIKPWLGQVVNALDDDEGPLFSEAFSADMKRYNSAEAWKAERFMGCSKAADELLNGFPAVVEGQPLSTRFGDPTLIILDADIPPEELGRIYDDLYVRNKAEIKNYQLWREAFRNAERELNALTTDDFMTYFWERVPEILERDRPPQGYTEETMGEQLTAYLPGLIEAFREEKFNELWERRQSALEPEKVEAAIRAQTGTEKRPKPPSLDQEILGRVASDVCLEGLHFIDDGDDFLMAVWRKYREWVASLGDQAEVLKVSSDYYDKAGSRAPNLQKIRTNLYKLEKSIAKKLHRPSPFRRSLHPTDLGLEM